MKKLRFWVYAILIVTASCNSNQKKNTLRVATAANLRFVMEEVNTAFEIQTGIKVEMVTASSGKLTAQIKNGAPYDVFISANLKYPSTLYKEGFTTGKPLLFCKGELVIWTNKNIELDSTLASLKDSIIEKIAIANPKNAPYGIAAKELLENMGFYDSIKAKLIFAENVAQLNQYILNKAVDVGITAKSAVMAPKLHGVGKWKDLASESYLPVEQYVVELSAKRKVPKITQKYIEYLSSFEAAELLRKYGYYTN